jgi:hypothetical protein
LSLDAATSRLTMAPVKPLRWKVSESGMVAIACFLFCVVADIFRMVRSTQSWTSKCKSCSQATSKSLGFLERTIKSYAFRFLFDYIDIHRFTVLVQHRVSARFGMSCFSHALRCGGYAMLFAGADGDAEKYVLCSGSQDYICLNRRLRDCLGKGHACTAQASHGW